MDQKLRAPERAALENIVTETQQCVGSPAVHSINSLHKSQVVNIASLLLSTRCRVRGESGERIRQAGRIRLPQQQR
jgi:hypothetical protein